MSSWGTGLYQNDVAEDIKIEYKDLLQRGASDDEALRTIIKSKRFMIDDYDDAPHFWFALADTQWRLGRLDEDVKRIALELIDAGRSVEEWESVNPKQAKKRAEVLNALKEKLLSEQPERKKISVTRQYKCDWKLGDVYAYPLLGDAAKENGLYGQYMLLHKVDERLWDNYHLIPIVRLKLTDGDSLPKNAEEFDKLKYICVHRRSFEDRIYPGNGKLTPEEERLEIMNLRCEPDENGMLREYKMSLVITSKRVIPKSLVYVGNFQDVQPPEKEFIPRGGASGLTMVFCRRLEDDLMRMYLWYNKTENPSVLRK